MKKFDLVIIGAGGAGFAAATKASELGVKTAMVNSGLPLGGTCVNVGCVPSKTLLEIASEYYRGTHPRFRALSADSPYSFNFTEAIREKDEIVKALRQSNYIRVARDLDITSIEGKATFISPNQVAVNGNKLEAKKFIIATGSRPRIIPFKGIQQVRYITSREALSLSRLPKSMIVIGGGASGVEIAQIYSRFGTKVTILEKEEHLLPSMDETIVTDELRQHLDGIEIHTGVDIDEMKEDNGIKTVVAKLGKRQLIFKGEELLLATGVRANTDNMGLKVAGVALDARGFIKVKRNLQTSVPHIWAAGDVIGKAFLEPVAAKEGRNAASNALEGKKLAIDYHSVPRAVFTDPQVASVGYSEEEFLRRFKACACRTVMIEQLAKAKAIKETRGLIKMAIHPRTQVVVGVHMVAPMAADLIHEAALAVKFKLTLADIIDTVHVFPTLSEAIKLVAQSFTRDISKMSCCVE